MTDIKTPEGRAALRAICEAAAEGPWFFDRGDIGHDYSVPYCQVYTEDETILAEINDKFSKAEGIANGKLFATARTALPACLDELDRQEAEIERLRADKARLRHALEHCKEKLGITDTFCPLGPAIDCAPIIRSALFATTPAKPFKLRDQFTEEEWAARETHGDK